MADLQSLQASSDALAATMRELQLQKADASLINETRAKLGDIKKKIALLSRDMGVDNKKKNKLVLKTPKGTKDWTPGEMAVREKLFSTLTRVFKVNNGVAIDTPVFELREILAGKYGEDSKLIYDLKDQGGEICSLRYDLTVPLARFLAINGSQYPTLKRYHIAKVYRRDNPAMTKGRMREFYQCDFDIAGQFDAMIADAEILFIACQALTALDIGEYTIKINHRKILDGIFEVCGVPADKLRTISSAVDKLDKLSWAEVKKEMTEEKGLDPSVADQIGEFVRLKGGVELLETLKGTRLAQNASAKAGFADMELLFKYMDVYQITGQMSFDMSLARGLDYYTGLIYEAVVEGSAPPPPSTSGVPDAPSKTKKKGKSATLDEEGEEPVDESQVGVGSIAAGGRYDELVGMFGGTRIPCVGISIGVERVFSILMQRQQANESARRSLTEVYVMSVGDGLLVERLQLIRELRSAGIIAEYLGKVKPKLQKQFETVDKEQVPFAVIIGPEEWEQKLVRVKEQKGKEAAESSEDSAGVKVPLTDLVTWLKERL